jgi:methyltransferase (TIGR00027 family)
MLLLSALVRRMARRLILKRVTGFFAAGAMLHLAATVQAVEPGHVSQTALTTCAYRAIGSLDPDPKTRNPDYLAGKLLGRVFDFAVEIGRYRAEPRRAFFFVTARTKHIDELLRESLQRGASQVVLLGAGLDSRAYRFHQEFPKVKFFEMDLPTTQEYKRGLAEKCIGPAPPTLIYTPIDFNTQTLGQALAKAGYERKAKTFFIWEGVTYYISAQAVDGTLRFIAQNSAPGSSVVFDYALEEVIAGDDSRFPGARYFMDRLASLGEPWVFGIADGKAADYVSQRGLKAVSDLDSREMGKRYLMSSNGKVYGPVSGILRMMHAEVP